MSLSRQILVALLAGVALGLFFGEKVAFFEVGGRAFVQLLQITVLPYVAGSLIAGFGGLRPEEAKLVATRGGLLLVLLWAITLGLVFLMPLALPPDKGGAFFSAAPLEAEKAIDWLDLYIPSNPFRALASNIVPAVVVFSILVGVVLMGMPRRDTLLEPLRVFNEAMGRVGALVTKVTPLGIFAIATETAGTMRLEEFERLQAFFLVYGGLACLLAFWMLPGLVAALTHVRHRRALARSQDALVTAFVTANLFVVLPLIAERARELLGEEEAGEAKAGDLVEVLVPTSFNFPHSAKLLSLAFVPFASWYSGIALSAGDYPALAGAGLLSVFGSLNAAIPFLLDLVKLPADLFQLFVVSSVVNSRFGTMAAAMHTFVVAVLGACLVTGRVRVDRGRLLRFAIGSAVLTAAFLAGTHLLLARALPEPASRAAMLMGLKPREPLAPASVLPAVPDPPSPPPPPGGRLDAIVAAGRLRVGFNPDAIPWAFLNQENELVGFDAEMAHQLGLRLGVRLEFVPLTRLNAVAALESGACDVVMSGVRATARRAERVTFSRSYAEEMPTFLVEDHRRAEFTDLSRLRRHRLRIAMLDEPEWVTLVHLALPAAEVVPVESTLAFVNREVVADALLTSWERAAAWSLLHPELAPAVPEPRPGALALAYAMPQGEPDLANLLNTFIDVSRANGRLEAAREHWIHGKATRVAKPRWSIAHDVIGWWPEDER